MINILIYYLSQVGQITDILNKVYLLIVNINILHIYNHSLPQRLWVHVQLTLQ